jgi:hypothetical protein
MMNPAIQDTYRHPIDTVSLLNWIIRTWDGDPGMPLMIVTAPNDGIGLTNRLRVKLAKVRTVLENSGMKGMKRFGMKTTVIPWSDADGNQYDCLCIERFVTTTQQFAMIFNRMDVK